MPEQTRPQAELWPIKRAAMGESVDLFPISGFEVGHAALDGRDGVSIRFQLNDGGLTPWHFTSPSGARALATEIVAMAELAMKAAEGSFDV